MKDASEQERNLIVKTQEILTEHGVYERPELLNDVFSVLSESEQITCVNGIEVITKYMKYHPQGPS